MKSFLPRISAAALVSATAVLLVSGLHAREAEAGNLARACIWKIEDGNNTVYLAGSVHLLRPEDYPIPPVYDEAYADSTRLFFEVDMAKMNSLTAQSEMLKFGLYPAGQTLKDNLSAETYALLQDHLKTLGMGGMLFDQMKPGMMAMTLQSLEALKMGAQPQLGLDMRYHLESVKDSKPSAGLETIEFQMTLFDSLTAEDQEDMLKATLESIEDLPKIIGDLVKAWHTGDAETLDNQLNSEFEESPELKELLLTKRNANWIPEIEKAIQGKENVMFVVGAGHLVGKDSVIDMLQKKGYQPAQMTYQPKAEVGADVLKAEPVKVVTPE